MTNCCLAWLAVLASAAAVLPGALALQGGRLGFRLFLETGPRINPQCTHFPNMECGLSAAAGETMAQAVYWGLLFPNSSLDATSPVPLPLPGSQLPFVALAAGPSHIC